MKKSIIIFILFVFTKPAFSQTYQLGVTTEYGRGYIDSQPLFKKIFRGGEANKFALSFYAEYKPDKPIFNLNSSLTIQTYVWNHGTLNFLKFPFGGDFVIGKKYQMIFGVNVYLQLLLFKPDKDKDYYSLLAGVTPDIGFCFNIYNNYSLFLRFQKDILLTPLYSDQRYSPGGLPYSVPFTLYDIGINIGLKIKLIKNKKEQ